jgi:hypothetical protein
LVTIVIDPDLPNPFVRDNLRAFDQNNERCPHLRGENPGEYSCAIYDRPWFKDTPCGQFTQFERDDLEECRIGKGVMKGKAVVQYEYYFCYINKDDAVKANNGE